MKKFSLERRSLAELHRRFFRLILLLCFVLGPMAARAQLLDANTNGMSDIWEIIYGASALNPNTDADADGVPNRLEGIAGTDPFDANSAPRVSAAIASATNLTVTITGGRGKLYQLKGFPAVNDAAAPSAWTNEASFLPRTSPVVTFTLPIQAAPRFFRMVISDVDTDGDGLNDWEEYQLGLDPLNPASSGQLDTNGVPLGDQAYVTGRLASQNVVSIYASDPTAIQPDPGQDPLGFGLYTITRGGFPLNSITVNLGLGWSATGFAIEGVDHDVIPRPVTLVAGVSSLDIPLMPLANPNLKSPVIALLKELPGTGYTVSIASNASVVIYPTTTPAGTGLTAQYFDNAHSNYANAANFTGTSVTRVEPKIDMLWGSIGSPNSSVVRDNFSASWDGRLVPTTTGLYQFDLQADDGARLYVNNQLIIDAWVAGSSTASPTQSVAVALDATTNYPIRVEYYEATNSAMIHLRWKTPTGSSFVGIPSANVLRPFATNINWLASYYNNTNLSGSPVLTNFESAVFYDWYAGSPAPTIAVTTYSARWTGQIQPQYSEPYVFVAKTDDGCKLWVNGQLILDDWRLKGNTDSNSVAINLQGGIRYDIKMEYFQNTGNGEAHLSWYSPSQPKQIVPQSRLYPTSVAPAPSAVTSPLTAVGFLGQPFSFTVTGANLPLGYTANGLPPGLSFNGTNGVISGVPALAGHFQITVTASNAIGVGASVVDLEVFDTGSAVSREVWTGVTGTNISDIPTGSPPNSTTAFGALQGITDYGDNYAERIRGYFTAPATGNYYFWVAGSDSAELWISNDGEPANKVRRAWVQPGGTAPLQWNVQPNQRSPWLALIAGQRYYVEVLHKAGVGAGDNWAVGWLQDPTGTNTTPAGVVPAYLWSRHFDVPPAFIPGTLYSANLLAQNGVASSGVGSATLRLSADESTAVVKFNYSGLTSPVSGAHIHADAYQNKNSQGLIICDFDEPTDATLQPDGSFLWTIDPKAALTHADIVEIIKEGKAYLNVHTVNFPAGEINGHFGLADGSQVFTPPPPPPIWSDDHTNSSAAARFLIQATFGPSPAEVASVQSLGYEGWIDSQIALPATHHLPNIQANPSIDPTSARYPGNLVFNTWWQRSVTAPDQLRQRVAFALSEIMVVSQQGVLGDNGLALSSYYDTLLDESFGNFRELLEDVTLSPAMGLYLDMRHNSKGDIVTGTHPNENYAREILQLFSIGLNRRWPDGTLVMDSHGDLVPTYTQEEILGFSRVFTGWDYYQTNQGNGRLPANWPSTANYISPMVLVPSKHELGTKRVLDNVVLPQAWGSQAQSSSPDFDTYSSQDLERALDSIFYNENVGPFICRQLIQRLVTSNPSRDYLYRVVQKFNDNGAGVRGDMQAVIKAILLDYEARSSAFNSVPTFGKQREPLLRLTAPARAFSRSNLAGTYSQSGTRTITIDTSPNLHRLTNNETIYLNFTSGSPAPMSQAFTLTPTSGTTFTVNAPGLSAATYGQSNTTITVTNSGHGLLAGRPVYLVFTSGGAINGLYTVNTVPTTSSFTVTAVDSATRSGNGLFPKWTGGGFTQSGTTILVSLPGSHGLNPGDNVYIDFAPTTGTDGQYTVVTVPDATHFTVAAGSSVNQTQNGQIVYPLVAPPLTRSGNVTVQYGTWTMNATDTGSTSSLSQTPLNSPTVFNFFFPDYVYPGILSSANLTTPEFQLTSDTEVILQMNFLQSGVLGNTGNTNGLSSYNNGNGSIVLDLSPWISPANASNAGLTNFVASMNSLLVGGQLSAGAQSQILSYAMSLPYTTPTGTQMRDRIRAVVHLIITSPDFTIQK